jgi:hypothetical protein
MSQRSKNLLEAFNQSKAPEKSAQPVAQPRGSTPRVGGPFADQAQPARPKAEPRAVEPLAHEETAVGSSSARVRVAVLCAVIAVTFFFIGRVSAPGVRAAGDSETAGSKSNSDKPPGTVVETAATSIEDALKLPSNKYSLLAATYPMSDEHKNLARVTAAGLVKQGLPAASYVNPTKKQIYLLVGAAAKTSDLDDLLARLKQANSDRGKKEFTSARPIIIDNYLAR